MSSRNLTSGKRVLKGDQWHDDNGPIPDSPAQWEPPMTDDERRVAALSDPDCQPLTEEQLARMKPVAMVKRLRWKLKLSQQEFADRFDIPVGTLRDWEQHRSEPDQAARNYLRVIEHDPAAVDRALAPRAA